MNFYSYYGNLSVFIDFFRIAIINLLVFNTALKLSNVSKNSLSLNLLFAPFNIAFSGLVSLLMHFIPEISSSVFILLFLFISFLFVNNFNFLHSLVIVFVSLCINSIFFLFAVIISYLTYFINFTNNILFSFFTIIFLYILFWLLFWNFRKFKHGFSFINSKINSDYLDIIVLNISIIIFSLFIFIPKINYYFFLNVIELFIVLSIIMAITIYKSFSLYYKHNLLVKELNDTKLELEKKDKEIERLEKENLEFSKTSHSIAHKQRVLEYKLNQLQLNTEFANELDLSDKLKEISDTYSSNVTNLTLPKTGIENIDDILEYMQSECTKNNINFELQLNGDIFSMVTTVINKEKLEILLADHIKNAIIAINSSENINRSILVRLGLINNIYSIYFYDSGIEFDEKVLLSLGKEQITTHKDIGGTGCGFLNTFDTLKEFNASLEINEISAPCKDNYTKSIVIKFDGKNDFTINSYKKQE